MKTFNGHAAVLLILSNEKQPAQILLTKRTEDLTHHSGEVAFPGGMWEEEDRSLLKTAFRECCEEVGLRAEDVEIAGQLPPSQTRRGIVVHPYIAHAKQGLSYLRPDQQEIASLKWVDIEYFVKDLRVQTDVFTINGEQYWAPVYQVDDYRVWGFTARLLVEYINAFCKSNIQRKNIAPEVLFDMD